MNRFSAIFLTLTLISAFIITFLNCKQTEKKQTAQADTFVGQWAWEKSDDDNSFSLHIYQKGDSLIGTYCGLVTKGSKMDCAIDSTDIAFWFKKTEQKSVEFTFQSYREDDKGKASLTLENGNLIWKTLEAPSTEHYAWDVAVMKRVNARQPGFSAR
jgi:hypothetical protein